VKGPRSRRLPGILRPGNRGRGGGLPAEVARQAVATVVDAAPLLFAIAAFPHCVNSELSSLFAALMTVRHPSVYAPWDKWFRN